MKKFILFCLVLVPLHLYSQVILTIEGTEVIDTTTGSSFGINIPRSQATTFTFRNNSLTFVNSAGYILQAGDEAPAYTNNNLDGEIITGNRFIWNGKDPGSTCHAIFTGFNLNVVIKYNYLDRTPNGMQRKSDGMTDISGVIAYNIINNPKVGIVVKGMNGVRIYNNTLYCENTLEQTSRGLIDIHTNFDGGLSALSTGTKVYNNIFYTKYRTLNIKIYEPGCLTGFESDYNLFWCESGDPVFEVNGKKLSFSEWQALGYDLHSTVINPDFKDFTDFVPQKRLDYGKDLGSEFQGGLSIEAIWGKTDPETINQGPQWQVGARLHISPGQDKNISFYPNPVSEVLYISINNLKLNYNTIKIFDLKGKIWYKDLVETGSNIVKIPKTIPPGLYNVALESDNLKRYTKKIVIVK